MIKLQQEPETTSVKKNKKIPNQTVNYKIYLSTTAT